MGTSSEYWFGQIEFPISVGQFKERLRPFYEELGIEIHICEEDYLRGWDSKESFNKSLERGIEI